MKIKDLPKIDRPREKLEKYGPNKLSNSELLAILLGTGTKGVNVIELSNKILKKFSGAALPEASVKDLKNVFGLGSAKACEIVACFALGKRLLKEDKTRVHLSPQHVWEALKDIRNHKKEHFVVFFLDSRNGEIRKHEVISIGTLNASLVHPREIFELAVTCNAAQIIVAHNHPSGETEPSPEDIEITKRLAEAGKLMGIELIDHVIVADKGFLSLKEHGSL